MEKPEQWEKIKEIVGAALEREPAQRAAFLDEVCAQDKALRAEVESLLSAYKSADDLSAHVLSPQTLDYAPDTRSIGPYRLIRKLGEGGMGQVWLAEQNAPVRRQVALKLLKAAFFDDARVWRRKLPSARDCWTRYPRS